MLEDSSMNIIHMNHMNNMHHMIHMDNMQYPVGYHFTNQYMALPFIVSGSYLGFIFTFQYIMKTKQPFDLEKPLIYWNLFLSLFSLGGAIQSVSLTLKLIRNSNNFTDTICSNASETWSRNVWIFLFVCSKIPELLDTVFIVARKRPLIFLHWYHHVTVLLISWHSYAVQAPQALYFIAMNYSVHTIMYAYYAMRAMNIRPPKFLPAIITSSQIMQMMFGLFVQLFSAYHYLIRSNESCTLNGTNIFFGLIIYGSYLKLFCDFAVKRYLKPSKKEKKK